MFKVIKSFKISSKLGRSTKYNKKIASIREGHRELRSTATFANVYFRFAWAGSIRKLV
jgi:hypothetical protein